jgi:hypothetical protein
MQKRCFWISVLFVLLVVFYGIVLAQFPELPKVPKLISDKIPGLDKILQSQPPITTNIKDAVTEVPFLDDFDPQLLFPMIMLDRTENGSFVLERPGLYVFRAQSYCLQAGAYAPGEERGGSGYLFAPQKGPQAEIVRKALHGSFCHPEIPQGDIQMLLWAIIARTKISDMSPEMKLTASKLLTPKELFELNGGALALIPEDVMDKAFEAVPDPVRRVLKAEAKLRRKLTEGSATYEELERIAVLHGVPPAEKEDREVPWGRWSYHPDGYFVRYFPNSYREVRIELSIPEPLEIERDHKGRITSISDGVGNRIETEYDDSVMPLTLSGEPSLKGYAFRSICCERKDFENPGKIIKIRLKNKGWTFIGVPQGEGKVGAAHSQFPGVKQRYEWTKRHKRELHNLDMQFTPAGDAADVMNLANYAMALIDATDGFQSAGEGWRESNPIDLVKKAWQYEVSEREGGYLWGCGCSSSPLDGEFAFLGPLLQLFTAGNPGGKPTYDPAGGMAQPGQNGNQRLNPSPRGKDGEPDCPGHVGYTKGDVKINGESAEAGDVVEMKDGVIETGPKSRVRITLSNGAEIFIGSNSSVHLSDPCACGESSIIDVIAGAISILLSGGPTTTECRCNGASGVRGQNRPQREDDWRRILLVSLPDFLLPISVVMAEENDYMYLVPSEEEIERAEAAFMVDSDPEHYLFVQAIKGRLKLRDSAGYERILEAGQTFKKEWEFPCDPSDIKDIFIQVIQ